MSPKKLVFKEPVVRASMDKIRFPRICPICGKKATKQARITTSPGKQQYLRPHWDPLFGPAARRTHNASHNSHTFLIHVCDEHYQSDEGDTNYKVMCFVGDGFLSALLLFALLIAGSNLWIGRPIPPYFYSIVGIFLIAIVVTILAFRSGPLNNAVKIIGFDTGCQYVWLKFKRADYRNIVVEENPMHTELVAWVMRGSTS
ncbi:MAG: hypothetical protein ACTSUB_05400 [Candidatus Thorarchaeota archaeon]